MDELEENFQKVGPKQIISKTDTNKFLNQMTDFTRWKFVKWMTGQYFGNDWLGEIFGYQWPTELYTVEICKTSKQSMAGARTAGVKLR